MQQAARVSQRTAFFHMGELVESGATKALFAAKNLERAGGQVCNITVQVSYLVTGEVFENREA